MADKYFDNTGSLLTEVTTGPTLKFKSARTGQVFDAKPEHTLTDNEDAGELTTMIKLQIPRLWLIFNRNLVMSQTLLSATYQRPSPDTRLRSFLLLTTRALLVVLGRRGC